MAKTTASAAPSSYRFRNISPLGDLELPTHRTVVKAGETIEVSDFDEASGLFWQPTNWESLDTGVDWGADPAAPEAPIEPAAPAAEQEGASA